MSRPSPDIEPLRILYQDDFLLAIDKPCGMLVHPGAEPIAAEWIAMKRVRDQLGQHVFPVHRLDRPTSGVLLFALDRESSSLTQQQFQRREVKKTYLAAVCGTTEEYWCCERPLRKNAEKPLLEARTAFERIMLRPEGSFPEMPDLSISLLKASPETGRFHQIRRHLQAEGFPIVGDFRYAGRDRSHELGALLGTGVRMLLQAKVLELRHPHSGEVLRIEAAVDEDFKRCFPTLDE